MQALSPVLGNWARLERLSQPTQVSGPSTTQSTASQMYAMPQQEQQTGGQTREELLKLQQQQQQQIMPLGQNYLRQFMPSTSTNYFQQLY